MIVPVQSSGSMRPNEGYEPKNALAHLGLPALVDTITCRHCSRPGDQNLWCDVCARLTHMSCAQDWDGHIVCMACSNEWQLDQSAALGQEQRMELERGSRARQEKADNLSASLNTTVANGAQLLGTAAGGVLAAATGGSLALGAGLA